MSVLWTLSVISGDVEYDLSDNETYILRDLQGVEMPPLRLITEQGPLQHGETVLGYRLQQRKMALAIIAAGGGVTAWADRRNLLLSLFRPSNSPLKLKRTDGTRVRQIDCYCSGRMEMPLEPGLTPGYQRVAVELYAPDPTWYDPTGVSISFGLGGGGTGTPVPVMPNGTGWTVGASAINQSQPIDYLGTWDAYPIITILGPVTSPVLTNETMGDKLDFTGVTINAGDSYVIDCRYGYKTVTRQSDGANRVQDLTNDSNLATFRIGAHPDVLNGTNSLRFAGTAINSNTQVYVQFNTRYVGV